MRDGNEAALLRSIAEESEDNTGRLVFADWLEEHGDSARAEFIRVQCELASKIPADRRQTLRVRERALLDEHRHNWIKGFGLPIEDVRFERGLIASMRLSQWDGGKMLDAEHASHAATLTELDLSELRIGDAGLRAFAQKAQFPAMEKLILSGNEITDAGVAALNTATGLPRLEMVYLFDNPLSEGPRAVKFHVDRGHRAEGYCMSPAETEVARRKYVRNNLVPLVSQHCRDYPRLQSAMLCVAQYWADEADDAVHGQLIVSELFEPMLEGVSWGDKAHLDPNVPNTRIKGEYGESGSAIFLWRAGWDDNYGAIPLWAAYAPEDGSQEYESLKEVYAPAVMFYRHGGYEFLPMCRPHLDGIQPESNEEE